MSTRYFKNFPVVDYKGKSLRNIMLKTTIVRDLLMNYSAFYEYSIKEGERITHVAYDYYGSVDFAWLVILSNQIVDPYFEWPLDQLEFDSYIEKKYGSRETAQSSILSYRLDGSELEITPTTFQQIYANGIYANPNFTPIYAYQFELEENEKKRNIRLIDNDFASTIALELEKKLK